MLFLFAHSAFLCKNLLFKRLLTDLEAVMTKKIMIIDDDPVIVNYLETLFNDNGYDTATANDGLEAKNIVTEFKPDLITLDLDMPNEWGPRFYRNLTKNKEFANIPVIVISGLAGREHSINKAVAFFAKPFDTDEILNKVKETIG